MSKATVASWAMMKKLLSEHATAYREVMTTLIRQHNGKVLDSPGDNLLAEFVSVVDAVQCSVAVQKEINARNTS